MQFEIVSLQCRAALTLEQWDRLDALDYLTVVAPKLETAGAVRGSIEYNGHFGRNIFFTVDTREEGESVMEALETLLKRQTRAGRKAINA
jgi:hypothetical protein